MGVDRADGAALIGVARSTPAGVRIVFDRRNPDGTSRWTHVAAHDGHVLSVASMRDGSWLVTGQFNTGLVDATTSGFVMVLEDDGRVRWQLAPSTQWVGLTPALSSDGRIFVSGMFFRGALQMPGGPRWTSRRRFTTFVGELDAQRGQLAWSRLVEGGAEGTYITVTSNNTIVLASHRARASSGQDLLLQSFNERGSPLARRTIAMPAMTYPQAIRTLSNGSFAVVTSTDGTGTDPTVRLGLFTTIDANPTWTTLAASSRLVAAASASAPLEVLVLGAHAGIYDGHIPLAQGARVLSLDPSTGATTREQWIASPRSIAAGSLAASHGQRTLVALAERDPSGRFSLEIGAVESMTSRTNPGQYTLDAHRAALARAPVERPMF